VVEPILPAGARQRDRRPLLGYGMIFLASTLFAINGAVSKVIQDAGLSSARLTQVRSTGAFLGFALVLAATNRRALRLRAREVPLLVFFGVCGLAFVQWFYFIAIHRLAIGIALLLQYLAPLLVALWARFVGHEEVRRRIWIALALALSGLALVVEIWSGIVLDELGVAACFAAALSYALYILVAEHAVATRDPISLSCYGFFFASLFWAVVQPWWGFPDGIVGRTTSLHGHLASLHLPVWALVGWLVVLGAIVPFALVLAALRHVSATRAGIAAMLELPAATLVAFVWLGESLGLFQLVGGGVVLGAIALAQTSR
jgi:drug/metabolite transporter (DMT)-like permease